MLRAIFLPTSRFEMLREHFLQRHGRAIRGALRPFWGPATRLSPVPLEPVVQNCFLEACAWPCDSRILQPAFHGTDVTNFRSIFSCGLLVPGASGVTVAHGSAHGNGIYTAKLSAVSLSLGFARGSKKLLVCGVVDDTLKLHEDEPRGRFSVTAKSNSVLHVGDAVVVFDSAMVAPLFVAEGLSPD